MPILSGAKTTKTESFEGTLYTSALIPPLKADSTLHMYTYFQDLTLSFLLW